MVQVARERADDRASRRLLPTLLDDVRSQHHKVGDLSIAGWGHVVPVRSHLLSRASCISLVAFGWPNGGFL